MWLFTPKSGPFLFYLSTAINRGHVPSNRFSFSCSYNQPKQFSQPSSDCIRCLYSCRVYCSLSAHQVSFFPVYALSSTRTTCLTTHFLFACSYSQSIEYLKHLCLSVLLFSANQVPFFGLRAKINRDHVPSNPPSIRLLPKSTD